MSLLDTLIEKYGDGTQISDIEEYEDIYRSVQLTLRRGVVASLVALEGKYVSAAQQSLIDILVCNTLALSDSDEPVDVSSLRLYLGLDILSTMEGTTLIKLPVLKLKQCTDLNIVSMLHTSPGRIMTYLLLAKHLDL